MHESQKFRLSSEKCTNRKIFACQVKNARIAKIFACQVKNARITKIFACQMKNARIAKISLVK